MEETDGRSLLWSRIAFPFEVVRKFCNEPPSSTLCSTTTLPTGKNYSNLLWRDGKSPSNLALDLAVTEFLCGSAHTDDCSLYISLLDHSDQRLGFGSIKSPQLHHGNAGVGSPCLESTLVPSEFGLKPISLSAGVKKLLPPLLGLLLVSSQDIRSVSVNSYCHELTMCICCPKLTSLISRHGLGKLERLSLIDLSFLEKFISTSSHRGWERSLSPFSSFMEKYLPSHPSYTESSTNSTNQFELYNQFELLTPFVMLQISSNNHIGLYKIFHEAWQLKLCDLSILSILISCLATKLAVCNDNGAVKALNYCKVSQV
ncbi:Uncharacterized protein Rs2_27332 [Raphanus sativus]|nr:Uncharacterized protein Rs2_27332 [Raphanus sativus]